MDGNLLSVMSRKHERKYFRYLLNENLCALLEIVFEGSFLEEELFESCFLPFP